MTRYHYSLATILMLIVLRLNIGWHFYSEGMHHVFDRSWSSEGFLRAAKGPLAPHFQQYLPDRYGWDKIMHGQYEAGPATDALINGIGDSWRDYRKDLAAHYKLSEEQSKEADAILKRRQGQLDDWRSEHQDAINDYLHEWNRLDRARAEKSAGWPSFLQWSSRTRASCGDCLPMDSKTSHRWRSPGNRCSRSTP
jgi:hypothetical protein